MNTPTADKIRADMQRLLDDLLRYAVAHPEIENKMISARAAVMCGVGLVNNALNEKH
jgi:hypothetical protein